MELIQENWQVLLHGVGLTLGLTLLGFAGALVVGIFLAICRVSPIAPLRIAATIYVEFFRNIPLLSLLMLVVFGLPDIGLIIPLFWCGVISLLLSSSAFVCEAVRSGINTISIGQSEAARALGLSFWQQLRLIIMPQALAKMVQPLVNVFIGTLLGSSLCAAVGVTEITNVTQQLNIRYAQAVFLFLLSGLVYLIFALGIGGLGARLERKLTSATRMGRRAEAVSR